MDLKANQDQLYGQFIHCLEQLVKIYRSLLDLVRKEKDILISSDLDELGENNRAKEAMLIKIKSLENQRIKIAREMAQVLGMDMDAPRLLEMSSHFDAERAEKLRNLHSVLNLLVKRVSEINQSNERLVQSALDSLSGAMKSLRDNMGSKPVYENKGRLQQPAAGSAGSLVEKEA